MSRHLLIVSMAWWCWTLPLFSQEMVMHSTFSYDEASRVAHVYGATAVDYNTAYYYEIYIGLSLDFDTGQNVCTEEKAWEYNRPIIEKSCDYTVPADIGRMDFITTHYLNATYRYYQLSNCESGCAGWGDVYGFSLVNTGRGMNTGNQIIHPPSRLIETQSQTVTGSDAGQAK